MLTRSAFMDICMLVKGEPCPIALELWPLALVMGSSATLNCGVMSIRKSTIHDLASPNNCNYKATFAIPAQGAGGYANAGYVLSNFICAKCSLST